MVALRVAVLKPHFVEPARSGHMPHLTLARIESTVARVDHRLTQCPKGVLALRGQIRELEPGLCDPPVRRMGQTRARAWFGTVSQSAVAFPPAMVALSANGDAHGRR